MESPRRVTALVFTASFSGLVFQITLIRIFSISLWYHFAFMVISIAMLGLGLSGSLISLLPDLKSRRHWPRYSLLLSTSLFLCILVANRFPFDPVQLQWSPQHLLYLGGYYLVLMVPFVFIGLIVAAAFSLYSEGSFLVYGADLLGAGTGSIAALCLLNINGPEPVLWILPVGVALMTAIIAKHRIRGLALVLVAILTLLAGFKPGLLEIRISPSKALHQALLHPGARLRSTHQDAHSRIDFFEGPAARYAPGLSLRHLDPLPRQIGCCIDGNRAGALTPVATETELEFLSRLPSAAAYEIRRPVSVLAIDPGGGLPLLQAHHYGAATIHGLESNRLLAGIVKARFGGIRADVLKRSLRSGTARAWLQRTEHTYDLIQFSLTQSPAGTPTGFGEDHRLTVEAFATYLDHLNPDGMLSLSLFIEPPPRWELRLLATLLEAMRRENLLPLDDHVLALRSWGTITILIKRSPFREGEIEAADRWAREQMFDFLSHPGFDMGAKPPFIETSGIDYAALFRELITDYPRSPLLDGYPFDITPVRDDRPFPGYFLKWGRLSEIYEVVDRKWVYFLKEGLLLPVLFIQVCLFGVVLISLPLWRRRRSTAGIRRRAGAGRIRSLSYFALLGGGFMLVETVLLQTVIRVAIDPPTAAAVVLAALLTGSGAGSLLGWRIPLLGRPAALLTIPAVVFAYVLWVPGLADTVGRLPPGAGASLMALAILPLGMAMGIPLPTGIRRLGRYRPDLIPWAWAVNGCFSVLGPVLAVMLALSWGFSRVFWIGAGLYLLAMLLEVSLQRTTRSP